MPEADGVRQINRARPKKVADAHVVETSASRPGQLALTSLKFSVRSQYHDVATAPDSCRKR
jgi:hypothetical protein